MSIRKTIFEPGEFYHVFNRGVDKRNIFLDEQDILFYFHRMIDLNSEQSSGYERIKRNRDSTTVNKPNDPLVNIVAYCLLPNHFHLILEEVVAGGIPKFMQKIGTSYVKYFNKKYNRSGSLFQGRFKAKHITGELSLPTISVYVNLNYKHHRINPKSSLTKSSIFEYTNSEKYISICSIPHFLFDEIGGKNNYKKFAKETEIYFIKQKEQEKNYITQNTHFTEFE